MVFLKRILDRARQTAPLTRVVAAFLGVALIAGLGSLIHKPPQRSQSLEAYLDLAAGVVRVSHGTSEVPVVSNTPLRGDARVSSGPGSRALVRLADGTSVFLAADTALRLLPDGASIDCGRVWMDVSEAQRKPRLYRAGEVEIGAAGAGLEVVREATKVSVYVARGLVSVTAPGGRVEVHAGERVVVDGAQGPAAKPEVKAVAWWEDWTGGLADHGARGTLGGSGAGTLYGVELGVAAGSPARTLDIARQSIRAVIRDGLAETEVDQTFFNPNSRDVEGWYWFNVPQGAQVTGFALETHGRLVEGELIERAEARAQYGAAVETGHQPALLEWVDSNTFRARIYPVPSQGTRRAVLRYLQRLPLVEGRLRFTHPLRTRDPQRIGEFAFSVDLGDAGTRMELSTLEEARVEDGGRRVTMRRSSFLPAADFQLEARLKEALPPVRVARFSSGGETADYVMARWVPVVDWDVLDAQKGEVVVVVDTSAGGDEASRQLKVATAEAVLRSLSDSDRFALVALDVRPTVLHPGEGLAPAGDAEVSKALERLGGHPQGGATDLSAMFDVALSRLHGAEQPAVIYVGDGWATSGELGSEALGQRLTRALATSRARLFTVAVGADAHQPLLAELARAGGGQLFVVEQSDQATERALQLAAAIKSPTITDLEFDLGAGLDDLYVSANGKVSRGEEVLLVARTHHELPPTARIRGRLAGKKFERVYPISFQASVAASLVPKLWGAEAIRRLLGTSADPDAVRGQIVKMGLEYGLMTPFTSFLALESEQAYQQRGIPRRRSPLQGVRLSALTAESEHQALAALGFVATAAFGCDAGSSASVLADEAQRSEALPVGELKKDSRKTIPDFGHTGPAAASPAPGAPRQPSNPGSLATELVGAGPLMQQRGGRHQVRRGAEASAGGSPVSPKPSLQAAGGQPAAEKSGLVLASAEARECAVVVPMRSCSDVARRPLAERALLWERRLRQAGGTRGAFLEYESARATCELADWRAEARFLYLLHKHVQTAQAAGEVLGAMGCRPDSRMYLARLLLRRAVGSDWVAAVEKTLVAATVDWDRVDAELASIGDPRTRLEKLRGYVSRVPDDVNGTVRLCRALAQAGQVDEAWLLANRLRERGLMTPMLAREMGDVLARQGKSGEAIRLYSEIVEFDPWSASSRRLLGDIFLAHGWYDAAYQQYQSMTDADPNDARIWLRLAAAAAGSGRVDEALRLERRVSESEGSPGPDDPRRWARLLSAARLARLLRAPPAGEAEPAKVSAGIQRKLKELQLAQGPGRIVLVTWEDLSVDLALSGPDGAGYVESIDAAGVGLAGLVIPGTGETAPATVRVRGGRRTEPLEILRHELAWDGVSFRVDVREATLPLEAESVTL